MTTTPAVLRPSATPGTLLDDLLPGSGRAVVTGITLDSRGVLPGDLYVALPGRAVHGAAFAAH